ncbi:MAG: IS4 family transposase, partial [Romboutsia sp.]|nr:IS4 family transposase [Romboutsia sp.]
LCMLFAQLTHRESLRDIEICLRSFGKKLYHSGIRAKISRSTLAYANDNRSYEIYKDFASILIREARKLYINEPFGVELENSVYAFDASIISLCLSTFPWATFRESKAGIKLHTQLDLHGNIPVFIDLSEASQADVVVLDNLRLEVGSIYILDRGYIDFKRLYRFVTHSAFFIIRAKKGLAYKRMYSNPVDKCTGIKVDQIIKLTSEHSVINYPNQLRRIKYYDLENDRNLIFLTNNLILPAQTIADLYKCRWQVELFFKWIKQHLKIKSFFGTSKNAVYTQIWIAISAYVLVAIAKKRLKIEKNLYSILQFLSLTLFEKTPILQAFQQVDDIKINEDSYNQLKLFDS